MAVTDERRARRATSPAAAAALPGHELEVRDENGAVLPERGVGRIFARGPSLMRGYFDQPEETAGCCRPTAGWTPATWAT